MSRYGIKVSEDDVLQTIFKGLAGGEVEEDACIDLVEIVSMLIIPLLVKVNNTLTGRSGWSCDGDDEEKRRLEPPPTIVADVLDTILQDTLGAAAAGGGEEGGGGPPPLTLGLLRAILAEHDEMDVVNNEELIRKMILVAKGGEEEAQAVLDVETFARALTSDVNLYNVENETKYSTILSDVFCDKGPEEPKVPGEYLEGDHARRPSGGFDGFVRFLNKSWKEQALEDVAGEAAEGTKAAKDGGQKQPDRKAAQWTRDSQEHSTVEDGSQKQPGQKAALETGDSQKHNSVGGALQTTFILSQIDFVADNVRSWEHAVLVWLIMVFSYVFYVYDGGTEWSWCGAASFGCTVANAVLVWIQVMLKLTILGSAVGIGLSMGNNMLNANVFGPVLGLVATGAFVFFPAFYNWNTFVFDTNLGDVYFVKYAKWILPAFGFILVLLQLNNLASLYVNTDSVPKKMRAWFLGSNGRAEFRSKQAGIYKVNQLVKHAYDLHKSEGKENEKTRSLKEKVSADASGRRERSTRERALQNYSDLMDESEEVGGYFWAYKSFISGSLQETEGIWLSSRLMAAIAIMAVAVILLLAFTVAAFESLVADLFPSDQVVYSDTCFSTFDYEKCYFPFGDGFYSGTAICRGIELQGTGCLELFNPVLTGSHFQQKSCELLDQAYEIVVKLELGNLTCSSIFESVEGILNQNEYYPLEWYNICRAYSIADEETLETWMEADPNLNETSIEYCKNMTSYVYDSLEKHDVGNLTPGFDFCVDLYGSLTPSMCDRQLYRAKETIITYEINSTGTDLCQSVLSYCTPDPVDKESGTCLIGENNLIPFSFRGSTCRSYPEINNTLTFYDENVAPTLNEVAALMPEKWMVILTAVIGTIIGIIMALATTLVYIPSAIHTLMKFRSGVIPSLRNPKFLRYRSYLENMAYLMGSMLWGLVATTLFMVILAGGVVFLLVWQVTRSILFTILAQVIGLTITVIIKMGICRIFMNLTHAGYYRKRPFSANIFSFALECWYLALTAAFVIARFVKFLLSTALYVGRIDTPVLADGLLLDMDRLPRVFRQNLLSTDAHRHPYIELLGLIYLMKLRHGEDFGSAPGSAWRLLFVDALMPWLKKKRIQDAHIPPGDTAGRNSILAQETFAGILAANFTTN